MRVAAEHGPRGRGPGRGHEARLGAPARAGRPARSTPPGWTPSSSTPPATSSSWSGAGCRLADLQDRPGRRRPVAGASTRRAAAPSAGSSPPPPPDPRATSTAPSATCSSASRWSAPTAWSPTPAARSSRTSPATTSASCSPAPTARSASSPRWPSGCTRCRRRRTWVERAGGLAPPTRTAVVQQVVHSQLAPTAVELDRPADGDGHPVGAPRGHLRRRRGPDRRGPWRCSAAAPQPATAAGLVGAEPFGRAATWR